MSYPFYAVTDLGYGRTTNEDAILVKELTPNTTIAMIADGAGSHNEEFQPASIVINEIYNFVSRVVEESGEDFLKENINLLLKLAINSANRSLGLFKMANEDLYGGYATSLTICVLSKDNYFAIGHTGNTRLYILREGFKDNMRQLTTDHTKANKLKSEGKIDEEEYYTCPERLQIESGLGFGAEPELQIVDGYLNKNDGILMTTDGIHYAIRPSAISEIINKTPTIEEGCNLLIKASKELKYIDNASVILIINKEIEPSNIVYGETGDKLEKKEEDYYD